MITKLGIELKLKTVVLVTLTVIGRTLDSQLFEVQTIATIAYVSFRFLPAF